MRKRKIQNWDKTLSWVPKAIHYPTDENQIVDLILSAAESGKQIKAVGSALSWSDITDVRCDAIRCDKMGQVQEVNTTSPSIRVQAGVRLKHANEVLAQNGLAFDNFGSIVQQTAAGYIATGTHGTGGQTPILSARIEQLRLIDGLGHVHELTPGLEPELFSMARVNLGCLGIVTEITFRCIKAFDLEERLELVDFDNVLADLDTIVNENDYLKLWWLPYTDKIQVYMLNKTTKPRSGVGFTGFLDRTGLSGMAFTGLIGLSQTIPRLTPFIHNAVQRVHFHPHTRVDRSDRVFPVSSNIPLHQETEYAIPRDKAAKAIDKVRKLVQKSDYWVNLPVEVRFVAADDIPMSPAYERDTCFIGAYVGSIKWSKSYFAEFEELMHDYEGRPHWGKSFSRTREELQSLYPAFDDFDRLRQSLDPHGIFRNSFVDRVFNAGEV